MQKTIAVTFAAFLLAAGLSSCTSTTVSDPAPVKVPSLAAHLAQSPDDAPSFTDLTQKPFVVDGIGDTTIPLTRTPTATKSLSVFVSCATSSRFTFHLLVGATKFKSGAGGDCKGANDAGYGINVTSNALPTAIEIDVEKGTAFEVTIYPSFEVIP